MANNHKDAVRRYNFTLKLCTAYLQTNFPVEYAEVRAAAAKKFPYAQKSKHRQFLLNEMKNLGKTSCVAQPIEKRGR